MTVSVFPIDGELPTLVGATDPAAALEILRDQLPDATAGRFTPTRCNVDLGHYGRQHRCVLRYTVHGTGPAGGEAPPGNVVRKNTAEPRRGRAPRVPRRLRRNLHPGKTPPLAL